jgi:hypothetical protein
MRKRCCRFLGRGALIHFPAQDYIFRLPVAELVGQSVDPDPGSVVAKGQL